MKKRVPSLLLLGVLVLCAAIIHQAKAQNILQYGFETRDPIWVKGPSDASPKELAHLLTEETAHNGIRSELISLEAQQGTYIHYSYGVGRAPIVDELAVSVWIKSNRPGIQILARVVLPRERNPKDLAQPLTVLLQGDSYSSTSRWQQLTVRQPVKLLRNQQQLLRAQLKREVSTADAYVDRVVLNVYGGPGATQVWTDDLVVGPLDDAAPPPVAAPASNGEPRLTSQPHVNQRVSGVQLQDGRIYVAFVGDKNGGTGQPFMMRGIRHTGTPLKALHLAGFNTVFLDESTPPGLVEDAVNLGFWIVPALRPPDDSPGPASPGLLNSRDAFGKMVLGFLENESVLGWLEGTDLTSEQFSGVSRTAAAIRKTDPSRPVCVDVINGYRRYSLELEQVMLGTHRWPLMTSLDMSGYRDWLLQRRQLMMPGTYSWTWIQTHLPDPYTAVAYDQNALDVAKEPIGPQPEQIRLMAYTAIGAGYRGLGFWSDRYLADTHTGRDRLLALALLNQELQMLEPLLAAAGEPTWIDTSSPNVKAAVLRSEKATLVLPIWMGAGGQCVPGQSSSAAVEITVPHIPDSCQCWEVSPGDLHSLRWERVVGGTKVTLREFSMTAALVFTSDLGANGIVVRFQDHQRRVAKTASQWAIAQAQEELKKVEQVDNELNKLGHKLPDEAQLLEKCRGYLETAERHRKNDDWSEAYADAQRAVRPLRIMMRAHWELAMKELTTPMASPYALSFYTLPRHWKFWQEVKTARAGSNLLPDGNFEMPPDQVQQGWMRQESPSPDEVTTIARRVPDLPANEGKQCLMLQVKPRDPTHEPVVLERTYIAVHTPAIPLKPGSLVRISASVRIPKPINGSPDGMMLYDSAGGEQMALRFTGEQPKWKKYILYRRVPASGSISVTMALTGLGTAYVDDVRIEPLTPGANPTIQTATYRPR
jgi:hypothetical protein